MTYKATATFTEKGTQNRYEKGVEYTGKRAKELLEKGVIEEVKEEKKVTATKEEKEVKKTK